jgi:hypothetical protein
MLHSGIFHLSDQNRRNGRNGSILVFVLEFSPVLESQRIGLPIKFLSLLPFLLF